MWNLSFCVYIVMSIFFSANYRMSFFLEWTSHCEYIWISYFNSSIHLTLDNFVDYIFYLLWTVPAINMVGQLFLGYIMFITSEYTNRNEIARSYDKYFSWWLVFLFKFYLFLMGRWDNERGLPSVTSFPKWLQWPEMRWAIISNFTYLCFFFFVLLV